MRKYVMAVALALLSAAGYAVISPELQKHLDAAAADQMLPVHAILNQQFDRSLLNGLVDGMPKPARRLEVARILQEYSAEQQAGVLECLRGEEQRGRVNDIRSLWIINGVYCEATPAVIRALSARSEVNYVNYDLAYAPGVLEPACEEVEAGGDEIAWGVQKIDAPAVWALGYTGEGVVCGHIDTGCNYNHPDLADHMWTDPNYPNHGWNFENNTNDPMDVSGHGTHTAGTVASDGTAGSQCGVAPDAQIMACRVRTVADSIAETQCWQAMQFCVSPPLSPSHGADLYTMSLGWLISWDPDQASWRTTANNVNAAGLSQVVAAGNERGTPIPNCCRCPGNVPPPWWNPQNTGSGALSGIVSIGATDSLDSIADFSSQGPVTWQTVPPFNDYVYPPGLTRPDVSAPGVDVKSCSYSGGYTLMSGTSMATPHTAGTVCLMLSKNPNLVPAIVDSILEITAKDLGPAGKDNDFGAGRIDAFAAVDYVTGSGGPSLRHQATRVIDSPPGGNANGRVDRGETPKLEIALRNNGGATCANTHGVLRSGDSRLAILDSLGTWDSIPSGGQVANSADRFELHADIRIPEGLELPCTLYVTGDSADYSWVFPFLLRVGLRPVPSILGDLDTGYCRLTVSCIGSIGYDFAIMGNGRGFRYPKTDSSILRYGSFAVGNGPGYVADRYFTRRAPSVETDFRVQDSLLPLIPSEFGDEQYRGSFNDSGHRAPKGLVISQNSYQSAYSGYDDFVILEYDIRNEGVAAVNGLYGGVFADFNIRTGGTADACLTDTVRRFTYNMDPVAMNRCAGLKILWPHSFANLVAVENDRYITPDSCLTDSQKFRFLNGSIVQRNSTRRADWSSVVSVGPFDLAVDSTYRFAVAVIGSHGEVAALAFADSAQLWYDRIVGLAERPGAPQVVARVLEVTPNPFTDGTIIRYEIPTGGRMRITIADVSGRTVASILDQVVPAGSGEVRWSPADAANGVYFVRLEAPGARVTRHALLVR